MLDSVPENLLLLLLRTNVSNILILCNSLIPTYCLSNVSKNNRYLLFYIYKTILQKGFWGIWCFLRGLSCLQICSSHKEIIFEYRWGIGYYTSYLKFPQGRLTCLVLWHAKNIVTFLLQRTICLS